MNNGTKALSSQFICCEKTTSGRVDVVLYSFQDRRKRALKALVIALGATLGSVFIPVAHFVLVPLLLLATPVIVVLTYRKRSVIAGGEGPCPMCGGRVRVDSQRLAALVVGACEGCGRPVDVRIEDDV